MGGGARGLRNTDGLGGSSYQLLLQKAKVPRWPWMWGVGSGGLHHGGTGGSSYQPPQKNTKEP